MASDPRHNRKLFHMGHHNKIAAALGRAYHDLDSRFMPLTQQHEEALETVATKVAEMLAQDNDEFNTERFAEICSKYSEGEGAELDNTAEGS